MCTIYISTQEFVSRVVLPLVVFCFVLRCMQCFPGAVLYTLVCIVVSVSVTCFHTILATAPRKSFVCIIYDATGKVKSTPLFKRQGGWNVIDKRFRSQPTKNYEILYLEYRYVGGEGVGGGRRREKWRRRRGIMGGMMKHRSSEGILTQADIHTEKSACMNSDGNIVLLLFLLAGSQQATTFNPLSYNYPFTYYELE